ncbi:MAG: calcium:proton exchanger [Lachnospiraceae bacterium]
MERRKHKISYVKKPFAKKSLLSLVMSVTALILCVISLYLSIAMQGNGDINVGAWGLSSFIFTAASLIYGGLSFMGQEMNYILAKISIGLSGLLMLFWICMLIIGLVNP